MANSKGQGLPLSFIVIAAISALVLIIVIAFTIGGLGGFFKQLIAPAPEEIGTIVTACTTFCSSAQLSTSIDQFARSDYCRKTFAIDLNKDGKIDAETESGIHCYEGDLRHVSGVPSEAEGDELSGNGPSVSCSVVIGGTAYTVSSTDSTYCS